MCTNLGSKTYPKLFGKEIRISNEMQNSNYKVMVENNLCSNGYIILIPIKKFNST
jgi:hypothetical protein